MHTSRNLSNPFAAAPGWLLCLCLAVAQPVSAADPGVAEDAPPEALVKNIVDTFRYASRKLRAKSEDMRQKLLVDLVNRQVMPWIDYPYMTHEIFINHQDELAARGMTEDAVKGVEDAFRARFVKALRAYTNYKIRVFKAQIEGDTARVHVKVDAYNTFGSDVYLRRNAAGHWKVIDVHIVGASIVEAVRKAVDKGVEAYGYDRIFELMQQES